MDLVHIRLDDRHHGRGHGLQTKDGRLARMRTAVRMPNAEQDGEQKPDPEIDDRFTHYSAPYPGHSRPIPQADSK